MVQKEEITDERTVYSINFHKASRMLYIRFNDASNLSSMVYPLTNCDLDIDIKDDNTIFEIAIKFPERMVWPILKALSKFPETGIEQENEVRLFEEAEELKRYEQIAKNSKKYFHEREIELRAELGLIEKMRLLKMI